MSPFAPARRRGHEILDDAAVDRDIRIKSIGDVTRSNILFGGRRAALRAIDELLISGESLTLLDVGTGLADIPAAIAVRARARGTRLTTIGLDEAGDLLEAANGRLTFAVCGGA